MPDSTDDATILLGLAADDEFAARSVLSIEGVTDAIFGFHAQQAVEKSLKAMLAFRGVDYPYSHDLDGLIQLCGKHEIEVPEDLSGVGRLSVFGVALRYGSRVMVELDRDQALRWAAAAVEWARQQIEPPSAGDTTSDTADPQ